MINFKWLKQILRRLKWDYFFAKVFLQFQASIRGFSLKWTEDTISILNKDREIICSRFHYVYAWDLIHDFDFYFNAVVSIKKGDLFYNDYSQPGIHQLPDSKNEFLFTSLPESEKSTTLYLQYALLELGHVVFDCGAYCGASTHAFAKTVGSSGRVFAFEPDPENFKALQFNLDKHNIQNVVALPTGIWSENGTFAFQAENSLGSALSSVLDRSNSLYQVQCETLQEITRRFALERIDFIKMDIEGAETNVLSSSKEFLRLFRPKLMIEPHLVKGRLNLEKILETLKEVGYTTKIIQQDQLALPLVYAEY